MKPATSNSSMQTSNTGSPTYVLMTAAYNEEALIETTIKSVLAQELRPEKWVIVSDGSTDRTDSIVEHYAQQHDFIHFLRVARKPGHSFSSKVRALHKAWSILQGTPCSFVGNLDADVSIAPAYFAELIARLQQYPALGLVSGFVYEQKGGEFRSRPSNRAGSVPHAAQLMRRECYEAIGGYSALKYGGEDWYAQICAKMNGWEIEAVSQLLIFHHKPTGAGTYLLRHRFRLGRLDYSFGSIPVFEIAKCFIRVTERPIIAGAALRLLGFVWCYLRQEPRAIPRECVAYLRKEQMGRLWALFARPNAPARQPATRAVLPERYPT